MKKSITDHHITPSSRGGKTEKNNLASVSEIDHENYHRLFGNKTPVEILDWLVNYFWKSKNGRSGYHFIYKWLDKNS